MKQNEVRLSKPQSEFFLDNSRFKQLVAGRRFGKSKLIAVDSSKELLTGSDKIMLYLAPTYPMAKKTMFYYIRQMLPSKAINKTNESDLTFYMNNGNIMYLAGSQNYDSHRGYPHLNKCYFDECADQPKEIWDEVVRPAISDSLGSVWFVGTPKGRVNWFYDLTENDTIKTYHFTTIDGGRVSEEELEFAKQQMDERTYRQEYLATFETLEGLVYYAYGEHNDTDRVFDPNLRTIVTFDFNVNPMSTILVQKDNDNYYAVKEFVINNSNTELNTKLMIDFLRLNNYQMGSNFEITGDYTGTASNTIGYSNYVIIVNKIKEEYGITLQPYLRHCKRQQDRVNATNSLFRSITGKTRLYVNKKECPKLDKDLRRVQWSKNGFSIDKSAGISDPSDALSYIPFNYEPIKKEILRF